MTATASPLASPPASPWVSDTVRIAGIRPEIADVATYDLEFVDPRRGAAYHFLPGQFNMLYLPGVGEVAISISADPASTQPLAHTIRTAGVVTKALSQLGCGATLGLRGPFGTPWPVEEARGHDLVLVAGGIGLAPLRPVICEIHRHRDAYGRVTILHGARTPAGLLFPGEFETWRQRDIVIDTTVDRTVAGWSGHVGVVTLLLDRLELPHSRGTALFACGPEVMMHYTAQSALARGVPAEKIWLSTERNMQCAIGLCGHCQFGPVFVCKEGPVFEYSRIAPFLMVEGL